MQQVELLQPVTTAILQVRSWEDANLPMEQSTLAFDLISLVTHQTIHGAPISLKHLFISLNYSEAGIRKQLRRCIKEQWLRLVDSTTDGRVRLVIAEPKLVALFHEYGELLRAAYTAASSPTVTHASNKSSSPSDE
jgi:hypothetical protein